MKLLKYFVTTLWSMALCVMPDKLVDAITPRINVLPMRIDPLQEGKTYSIYATLDEPIICPPDVPEYDCNVILYFDNPDNTLISIDPCWVRWDIHDWHNPQGFNITAIPHYFNVPQKELLIKPRVIRSNSEYYNGFQPSSIAIKTKPVPTATCSSTGDPHYTSFDGSYFHFYGRGREWLVKTKQGLGIQTITQGAGYSRNCALAILENGNYILVSVCNGSPYYILKTLNSDTSTHPKILSNGGNYDISFPSGVTANFQPWGSNANIYVTLPGTYYQSGIMGLCGNWDGVASNDGMPYVTNEWDQLPVMFRVNANAVDDLFSITDDKIRGSLLAIPAKLQLATCAYVPPKYIKPILNNPDVEDITNIIKQYGNSAQDDNRGFTITDEDLVVGDVIDPDIELDMLNQLFALCDTYSTRPEIAYCPEINIYKYITACKLDVKLAPSEGTIQENWLAANSECKSLQTAKIHPVNTSIAAATDAINALVIRAGPCANIICALNALCEVDTGRCVCLDIKMHGPKCNIPISAEPELVHVRPVIYEVSDMILSQKPMSNGLLQSLRMPNTIFMNYITQDDNISCMVYKIANNLNKSDLAEVSAQYLGDGIVSCPIDIPIMHDEIILGPIFLFWQIRVNNKKISVIKRQILYSNPCIQCDVQRNQNITKQESCARSLNMCFPSKYREIDIYVDNFNDIYSNFRQQCVTVGASPNPYDNPCLVCNADDSIYIDWFKSVECKPRLLNPVLESTILESMLLENSDLESMLLKNSDLEGSKISKLLKYDLVSGLVLTADISVNLQNVKNMVITGRLGNTLFSVDNMTVLASLDTCNMSKCVLSLNITYLYKIISDSDIVIPIDIYWGLPIDSVKIDVLSFRIKVLNNPYNDQSPTTVPTSRLPIMVPTSRLPTTISQMQSLSVPATTTGGQFTQSDVVSTSSVKHVLCIIKNCDQGCNSVRSDVSGCILSCLCQQTRPQEYYDNYNYTTNVPLTLGVSTIGVSTIGVSTISMVKTLTDDVPSTLGVDNSNTSVVMGSNGDGDKMSYVGLAFIVVTALCLLSIMLAVGYRIRNMPLNDVSDIMDDKLVTKQVDMSRSRVEPMNMNPVYVGAKEVWNMQGVTVYNNPIFVESDMSISNVLYDALYSFESGTYKFVGVDPNYKLYVKDMDDVLVYDVENNGGGYELKSGIDDLSVSVSNPLYFVSLDEMVSYYSVCNYPLSVALGMPLSRSVYADGDLYTFNNTNIKNIPVSSDQSV